MENIIVEEGGFVERLLFSEVFMARMIFIKLVHKLSPFNVCKTMVSHYKSNTKMQWLTSKNAETIRYILATY